MCQSLPCTVFISKNSNTSCPSVDPSAENSIPADPTVRNFSYTVVDDKIYYRENSRMTPVEVSATAENRIKGMIAIRNSVRTLIELQTEDYHDSEIKAEQ